MMILLEPPCCADGFEGRLLENGKWEVDMKHFLILVAKPLQPQHALRATHVLSAAPFVRLQCLFQRRCEAAVPHLQTVTGAPPAGGLLGVYRGGASMNPPPPLPPSTRYGIENKDALMPC